MPMKPKRKLNIWALESFVINSGIVRFITTENSYSKKSVLYRGKCSKIYKVREKKSNLEYALKIVRDPGRNKFACEQIQNEISILRLLNIKGVVKFKDSGTVKGKPFIVLEYIHGPTLWDYLHDNPGWGFKGRVQAALVLLDILQSIHSLGIVHRDLNFGNILLTGLPGSEVADLCLIDFQYAGSVTAISSPGVKTIAGSTLFMAPEAFLGTHQSGIPSDMYSFGILLYVLYFREDPFYEAKRRKSMILSHKLTHQIYRGPSMIRDRLDEGAFDLVMQLTHPDIRNRLSAHQIIRTKLEELNHQINQGGKNEFQKDSEKK